MTTDTFRSNLDSLGAAARAPYAITPSDTVALPILARLRNDSTSSNRYVQRGQIAMGFTLVAGVALVLIGVATLSPLLRRSSGRTSGAGRESTASNPDDPARGWLPSRDTRP